MTIFLMAKQIVDILYEFKVLDYTILIVAFVMFLYKFIKCKMYKNIKEFIVLPDFLIIGLFLVYTFAFLKRPEYSFGQYVKTISAFAIYFLGRVYWEDLEKNSKLLAIGSHVIIYANAIYKVVEYYYQRSTGLFLPRQTYDFYLSGGLYYYKTDLLVGLIVAVIFVYAYAPRNIFKYFTIFIVTGLLAFTSKARMGQVILVAEYLLILFLEIRKMLKKNWHISLKVIKVASVIILVCITAFFIILQVSYIHSYRFEDLPITAEFSQKLENIFHSRHIIWWDSIHYFTNQNFGVRTFGIDLWSEVTRNSRGDRFHCLYMKLIYSVGYVGVYLFATFICYLFSAIRKKEGYVIKYITIALWMMFLLMAVSMEAFEYTQMSWYPFIFAGAIVSKKTIETKRN